MSQPINPFNLPPPQRGRQRAKKALKPNPFPVVPPPPPAAPPPPPPPPPLPIPPPAPASAGLHNLERFRRMLAERARRTIEALRLYEPLPVQAEFHADRSGDRLLRGSNRGGKTLPAAVEVARALCGMDPHKKYPERDGRAFAVGKNLDHVGAVMWRKLSRAGAFKIIRDQASGRWRAFRPWEPADQARERMAKPAPPLIPPRMIRTIAWENKAKGIPKMVTFHNGWELTFYSSEGKPPRGSDIDLWWFDEEIIDDDWYPEMSARVLDRKGVGIWSATPQSGTERLLELHDRAELERDLPQPSVREFVILIDQNPHIGEKEKREFFAKIRDDERLVRIGGEFAVNQYRVYPEFNMVAHGCEPFPIPRHWTQYMIVDPGRQVCAVLFGAIPPPEEGFGVYLHDELYILNCDAEQFGRKVASRVVGREFESFIIDRHGGRITDIGSGVSAERQYSNALRKYGVKSNRTGYGFTAGSDDAEGGIEAMRAWLRGAEDGAPKLRVFHGCLPNLEWEFRHYRYKRIKTARGEVVTDKPEERGRVHLMACCRYFAAAQPRYVRPKSAKGRAGGAVAAFRKKQERQKKKAGGEGLINLGPGQRRTLHG